MPEGSCRKARTSRATAAGAPAAARPGACASARLNSALCPRRSRSEAPPRPSLPRSWCLEQYAQACAPTLVRLAKTLDSPNPLMRRRRGGAAFACTISTIMQRTHDTSVHSVARVYCRATRPVRAHLRAAPCPRAHATPSARCQCTQSAPPPAHMSHVQRKHVCTSVTALCLRSQQDSLVPRGQPACVAKRAMWAASGSGSGAAAQPTSKPLPHTIQAVHMFSSLFICF